MGQFSLINEAAIGLINWTARKPGSLLRVPSVCHDVPLSWPDTSRVPTASDGNNDWKRDRIPNPPSEFSDHAVP